MFESVKGCTCNIIPQPEDISFLELERVVLKTILPYMDMTENLVLLLGPFDHTFILHSIRSIHMKFEFNWASGFREVGV